MQQSNTDLTATGLQETNTDSSDNENNAGENILNNVDQNTITYETKGQMAQRHKREVKELQSKIAELLRSVPKKDKEKRQKLQTVVAKMEADLKQRHETERQKWETENQTQQTTAVNMVGTISNAKLMPPETNQKKPSRAQRRRAMKAAKEKEHEERIAQEKKSLVSNREIEYKKLQELLAKSNLTIKEITPDGNCLYNAVNDQLKRRGHAITYTAESLRNLTADYIQTHSEEFVPFMDSTVNFDEYVQRIRATTEWGGQLEIQALANALRIPIWIYSADAPIIKMGENYKETPLLLAYHKHAYTMGEHYNSIVEKENNANDF